MNKKQLIVVWVMGILISLSFIIAPYLDLIVLFPQGHSSIRLYMYYFQTVAPLLIIGGLAIYTLRNKKK